MPSRDALIANDPRRVSTPHQLVEPTLSLVTCHVLLVHFADGINQRTVAGICYVEKRLEDTGGVAFVVEIKTYLRPYHANQ